MDNFNNENDLKNEDSFNNYESINEPTIENKSGEYSEYFNMNTGDENKATKETNDKNTNGFNGNIKNEKTKSTSKAKGKIAAIIGGALVCAMVGGAFGASGVYYLNKDKFTNDTGSKGSNVNYNPPAFTSNLSTQDGLSTTEAVKKVAPAVVGVSVKSTVRENPFEVTEQDGIGSGFIINEDGYVVTNYHVISGANEVKVILSDGKEVNAKVVNYDAAQDIAVVKITDNIKVPGVADLGDSAIVQAGEDVIAIGNPLGKEFSSTVTKGIISSPNRKLKTANGGDAEYIQTDTAINPGNSGGPLINSRGQVIGINSAKKVGEGIESIGFSIPINKVKERLDVLSKPILKIGISIRDIDEKTAKANKLQEGVYVTDVSEFSPAEKAGVKRGDLIINFDGNRVKTSEELNKLKATHKDGDTVKVVVVRDSKEVTLEIKLQS